MRKGPGLTDELAKERLETGALLEELESRGDRIRYRLQQGAGPREGWVTVKLAGGKDGKRNIEGSCRSGTID